MSYTETRKHPARIFGLSILVAIAAVVVGGVYGGIAFAALVLLLVVFEVSLSFDNAIVNARIVEKLSPFWQKLFLTVGVLIAVFGMRLLFPLVIVGVTTGLNPVQAWNLALEQGAIDDPGSYAYILHHAHPMIAAFGGMFLLMLFLDFILDPEREIHWLRVLEAPLAKLGKLDIASVVLGLGALLTIAGIAGHLSENEVEAAHLQSTVLISGILGMVTYLVVNGIGNYFEKRLEEDEEKAANNHAISGATKLFGKAAFASFLYLEVLDASFSFDGVIGALAITTDPIVIALGLGAGAMFVRSMTIYLVNQGTLNEFRYLDHGAHWAIGALAVLLITSIAFPVPEVVTGLIGVALIVAAFISSVVMNRAERNLDANDTDVVVVASADLSDGAESGSGD